MEKRFKYILFILVLLSGIGFFTTLNADMSPYSSLIPEVELIQEDNIDPTLVGDTLPPRYPISKTTPEEYNDIVKQSPADLHDPDNLKTTIEYDIKSGTYIVKTKVGDMVLGTPLSLTPEEYQNYSLKQSIHSYFRQKNEEEFAKEANKELNLADLQFELGAAEKVFGKGGVRVKTQGSAEITMGLKTNKTDNPTLPERARSRTFFNFDEKVQLNVQANVGSKVNFGMNYNTETSFDFDSKKLNLAYVGEEDEIIKNLEAGNVSMTTNNSLIRGGAALFGIKADMQFGKLKVNTLFAQQESESKTVSSKGGVQTQPFEIKIDEYDENRHFFLAHYFRDNYDQALSTPPLIRSGIKINQVEVWVTNKRGNYDQSRNIVAFTDLGENKKIGNDKIKPLSNGALPQNKSNTLYETVTSENYKEARNTDKASQALSGLMIGGTDFEELGNARRLESSEFTIHETLGYISLKTKLQPDEVLAVAYEYIYEGKNYQVGEFATDNTSVDTGRSISKTNLFVKLLKGVSLSPSMTYWNLMMKNIYSLGAYSVQKEKFKLDIYYQSDTTGTYLTYLPEGAKKDTTLLKVMNLDRLDARNERHSDGFFDFVDKVTVMPENGRIIFPVVEPFGSHLEKMIGDTVIAKKYVFKELYSMSLSDAKQIAEKNKFILRGEYKASSGAEIQLGASNVARGSVIVKSGGIILNENVDYTVDYTSGIVTIINESVIASGSKVEVTLENQSAFNMQRKTMMGVDLNYQFNKDFSIGGTAMHLSEMPLVVKTAFGDESVKNTLWGLNTSYRKESQWLTNLVDKLPLLTLTKPSQISFDAEFAHLIAGHYENKVTGGYSYLDDFESTQSKFNLSIPYSWSLASTPYEDGPDALFKEARLTNNVDYGKNRALLAWYLIDATLTRQGSAPTHLRNDKKQLSSHAVRPIYSKELFPQRDLGDYGDNQLQVFNLAFYPKERGPYNLDADNINSDGTLQFPEKRWGGIMRKIDQSDFEAANIEYIEFWLLDPYQIKPELKGGDLYFNLGEVSEDILKDDKKFFENGLPINKEDSTKFETTVWGKVPTQQNTVYAFDNTPGARLAQDVGLNGLSSEEEKIFPAYAEYLDKLRKKLSPDNLESMRDNPYSQINDPAGDNFRHYRGRALDDAEVSILDRYKYYNGTEKNSQSSENSGERYSTASRTVPDIEDINQDNSFSKYEKYFQYSVSFKKENLEVGINHIVDKRVIPITLEDKSSDSAVWYQFKIPVKKYEKAVGGINDFKSIRFMRMYMTNFQDTAVLRFGTFDLVRGDWRNYQHNLSDPNTPPVINATLDVSTVNIEENSDRKPVNYVLPPGVTRIPDPSQQQIRRENEQALSLKVTNLAGKDARAIYSNKNYDLRQYKKLQLFTHAEAFMNDITQLRDDDLAVFIRLGSDYKNNYYEYEVPLKLTPHNNYGSGSPKDQETVWPSLNMLDIKLEALTNLKLRRNKKKREGVGNISFHNIYSEYDEFNDHNRISIIGNPSLSEVKVIMIGVRNTTNDIKSGEIWINELRLSDFNEEGGWAANANLNIALSDLGTVNLGTRIETAGFGGLDQSINERRIEDYTQYSVATTMELGKFFPEKAKVSMPIYYGYSKETIAPKYNPLDQDILLKDALDNAITKAEKDSIKNYANEQTTLKSISLNNVKVNIQSKNPMPYDPANFSFGYSYSENYKRKPDIEYETTKDYRGNLAYSYSPYAKPLTPFKNIKGSKGSTKYAKQLSLNYLPSNISFQSAMMRNYYETQLRNLNNTTGHEPKIPVSFSQNFYWDRAFRLSWNFTNNLTATFESGTNARIEEPYLQVNKKLNPDDYKEWKDSVSRSIADLGTPMKYDQKFSLNYNIPTQLIPALDWTTASVRYNASYNWDRGARMEKEEDNTGNIIKNQRQFDIQGAFNLQTLYNKNKFLKSVNQKFSENKPEVKTTVPKQKPKLELDVQLNTDSGTIVRHDMLTKKLTVRARGANGKLYSIKFKALDYARILIQNKDTVNLKLTLISGPPPTEDFLYKAAEYGSRAMMMVRRFNIQYSETDGMMLPGFRPEIGDFFGQGRTIDGLSPGLGFAFGSVDRSYIDKAAEKNWLYTDRIGNMSPAIINHAKTLRLNMNLEPFKGLKIDLNADRITTQDTKIQFMYAGMPETRGGNFSMSTIALSSAFASKGDLSNNYASKPFEEFRNNRQIIANRVQEQYMKLTYPDNGFIADDHPGLVGKPFDPTKGKVNLNSTDVLIPAFIAAYTGKDANKISLSPFPSITSMLPNWRITYDGLVKIPAIKKYFKSMIFNHQYRGSYNVGSFTSFLNWANAGQDDLGFIRDILSNNPTPSSPYSISAVSITEGFNPLVGVDGTLLNNITLRAEYRTTRNLNLNISSYQLVESTSNEIIVGIGYKYAEFNKVLRMRKTRDFSNDLSVRADFSRRKMQSLIRKIEENLTQATSGNISQTIQLSADYGLSRALTLRAFYDIQLNKPLVSNASYPSSNSNYGLSVRFSLAQ